MSKNKDFYDILGIKKNASPDEIKTAYRKLAREYHPDRSKGKEQQMKDVNEAYSVLNDPKKRENYDRTGSAEGFTGGFGGGGADFGDLFTNFGGFGNFGGGSFHHINFEDLFGGGRQTSTKGDDIAVKISITIQEAFKGCDRSFEMDNQAKCTSCKGAQLRCPSCNGSGRVNFFLQCGTCNGQGILNGRPNCTLCRGSGIIRTKKKIEVTIDPGVLDGQKIKFSGMGSASSSGPNGDLIVHIEVKNNTKFVLEGSDLIIRCPINAFYFHTGTNLSLQTIDGRRINVPIPRGFQSEQVVVANEGFPYFGHRGRRGNLIIKIQPIGTKLNESDTAMLKDKFGLSDLITV
jgi:molecular chaperone DnaJ